jgi:malonyl-CoA decarboxylase
MRILRMASYLKINATTGFPYRSGRTFTRGGWMDQTPAVLDTRDVLCDHEAPLTGDVLAAYGLPDAAAPDALLDRLADVFAAEGRLQELFLQITEARDGPGFLVEIRRHLLQGLGAHPSWAAVEGGLIHVLKSAFNLGRLEFRRMDKHTPAPVLEKLIQYEAVHHIRGWRELRRRLEADRRCYGFFHPDWPGEPLAFTEVALTCGMSSMVQPLLDPESPVLGVDSCDCAIFYSVTNCREGLRGFALGSALIARVVDALRAELPGLRTFATLSPIPGFRTWLSALAKSPDRFPGIVTLVAKLDESGWSEDARAAAELERDLMPLCALYLLHAKEGTDPADPVARFHLANGARLRRINWLSDVSPAGLRRSAGLTANYVYHPTDLKGNVRAYATQRRVTTTRQLERLSRRAAQACDRPS